jgi:hypothetical protein
MEGGNMITKLLLIGGIALGGSMLFGFNVIPSFDFLGIQFNWVTALIIIAFIGVLIWGAIHSWKIFLALSVIGVLAMSYLAIGSFLDYRDMKARQSNTRGELTQRIPFENMDIHNFDVDINALVFMPANQNDSLGNPIMFVVMNFPRFDFVDENTPHWMLINNRPVHSMERANRETIGIHVLLFSDSLDAVTQVTLVFWMTFYQTHTTLQIELINTGESLNLLMRYFMLNGLNIRLIEV